MICNETTDILNVIIQDSMFLKRQCHIYSFTKVINFNNILGHVCKTQTYTCVKSRLTEKCKQKQIAWNMQPKNKNPASQNSTHHN